LRRLFPVCFTLIVALLLCSCGGTLDNGPDVPVKTSLNDIRNIIAEDLPEETSVPVETSGEKEKPAEQLEKDNSFEVAKPEEKKTTSVRDKYNTEPVPEGKPKPIEPQEVTIEPDSYTCTLSVRCDTILANLDQLNPEKVELVPKDGIIFSSQEVIFYEGENVFNVLQREMKRAKIHLDFVNTPVYNSAYIKGIGNLYEFDCGELSGWMYKVNDWFPNYGPSRYQLQDGDVIEFLYTCDLGRDIGRNMGS